MSEYDGSYSGKGLINCPDYVRIHLKWWNMLGLNQRPMPYQGIAPPTELIFQENVIWG